MEALIDLALHGLLVRDEKSASKRRNGSAR